MSSRHWFSPRDAARTVGRCGFVLRTPHPTGNKRLASSTSRIPSGGEELSIELANPTRAAHPIRAVALPAVIPVMACPHHTTLSARRADGTTHMRCSTGHDAVSARHTGPPRCRNHTARHLLDQARGAFRQTQRWTKTGCVPIGQTQHRRPDKTDRKRHNTKSHFLSSLPLMK